MTNRKQDVGDEREASPSVSDERGRRSDASGVAGAAAPQPVAFWDGDRLEPCVRLEADQWHYIPLYASPQARTAAPGVPASVAERERFEAWVREKCGEDYDRHDYELLLDRYGPDCGTLAGRYVRPLIHARWSGWQAAMAPPPPHFMGHGDFKDPPSSLSGQPQWRDIESAPRDGRPVLVWAEDGELIGHMIAIFYDGAWFSDEYHSICEPTHWMALPEPPPTYDTKGREETRSDDHDETKSGGTAP